MEKKYTVEEFINRYEANEYINPVVIDYITMDTKIDICNRIVNASYFTRENPKHIHINSPVCYMLFCLNMIDLYTNIKIDFTNNSMSQFDMLNSCGALLDIINKKIRKEEVAEFETILNMTKSDIMNNNYEPHAFISNQIEKMTTISEIILSPILNKLADKIDLLDEKKINNMANKIISVLDKNKK